jgi:putative transposase
MARELDEIIRRRGKPQLIVSDNGTEFTSNAMLA